MPGSESEYVVAKGNKATFETMQDAIRDNTKAGKATAKTVRFEVLVEPDPVEQVSALVEDAVEEEDVKF